jgi:hypothetical protein
MSMPAECDPIYQSTVDEVANIRLIAYNFYLTTLSLESDKSSLLS